MAKAPEQIKLKAAPSALFSGLLLHWNKVQNRRDMPWKGEKDPYKIWLSEIILQQTRVEQGTAYYNRFVKKFPDVRKLANAPDDEVMKLWEGLGYYSRCRNLIYSARFISSELDGQFPTTYEEILELKGVGSYTAAAIGSFAFKLPYAVVDGNVFRVLARVFGIDTPTDSTVGKKFFSELAQQLLDKTEPGTYNQAIMDFGATICKPVIPLCIECPLQKICIAYQKDMVTQLPVREKRISVRKRWFNYLVLECGELLAVRQRTTKDIWQQLYEFPMLETNGAVEEKELLQQAIETGMLQKDKFEVLHYSPVLQQKLSHQTISGRFLRIRLNELPEGKEWSWLSKAELQKLAFPQLINQYLQSSNSAL
jgi:A/G-specific adenine glycosylase